jgi:S1-C subfamily serine protease
MRPRLPSAARRALLLAAPLLALVGGACAAPPPPVVAPPPPPPVVAPVAPAALTPAQIAARSTPGIVSIRSATGLGTGFVVRKDGWIATNLHVIAGARELVVATPDRHEYPVIDVLGVDPTHDLALLRIDAGDLRVLALGDSEAVRAGDAIVAIGHPLGLEDTVSNGLVSAIRVIDPARTVLQISAPIAPGSSGGPLFSDKGEVVGVATAYSTEGQNLNFGVPVRYLKAMMEDPHAVPLAVFAAVTGASEPRLPKIQRDVPVHDLAFLTGCSDDDLERAGRIIAEAIDVGAPVYNEHHFAACYHIYEGAALDVEKRMPLACKGPKKAMHDGRQKALKLDDPSAQAWAMRDAFDGLLEVMAKRLGGNHKKRR